MKPFVRYTALVLGILFVAGAAFAWFDVLTHENILTNPELKIAGGWLMTGLMLLALACAVGAGADNEPRPQKPRKNLRHSFVRRTTFASREFLSLFRTPLRTPPPGFFFGAFFPGP